MSSKSSRHEPCLTDQQIARLKMLLEHEGLQEFLPYAEQAAAEAKFNAARRLVMRAYRQMFIALVALIVAAATFWEKIAAFFRWAFKGLGQ